MNTAHLEPEGLPDRVKRDSGGDPGAFDDEGLDGGHRQRHDQFEARALAGFRGETEIGGELGDGLAHDIHADAAAGDFTDHRGRADAALKQDADEAVGVEPVEFGGWTAFADRRLPECRDVDAAAVVLAAEHDLTAAPGQPYADPPLRRLAGRDPVAPRLDAVGDGIADHLQDRVLNDADDMRVETDVAAFAFEDDLLAEGLCRVAGGALEIREQRAGRNEAKLFGGVAHLAKLAIDALMGGRDAAFKLAGKAAQKLGRSHEPVDAAELRMIAFPRAAAASCSARCVRNAPGLGDSAATSRSALTCA